MNTGSLKRSLGLVLIYIGVFVAIVFIQFARSPGFLARSGRLSVSASWATADRKGQPSSVKIQYAGLAFELSALHQAQVRASDGSLVAILPSGVEKIPGGARIILAGGGEIRAVADSSSLPGFRLSATPPRPDSSAVILPYVLSGGARFTDLSKNLVLESSGGPFSIAFLSSSLDTRSGKLTLSFDGSEVSSLDLRKMAPPAGEGSTAVGSAAAKVLPQAPMDPVAYKAALASWSDKTWLGLSAGRWDAASLGWKDATGAPAFSEKALAAYLAESAQRGGYADALARMRLAAARNPSSLSWISTPFLGNTVNHMEIREGLDVQELKRLSALLSARDPSILEKEGLVRFLMDRAPYVQAQEAFRFIAELDPSKLDARAALGYLAAAVEAKSYLADADNPFQDADAASTRLVAAITKSQEGWFLKTDDDGPSDLRLSLEAGMTLVTYGGSVGKDVILGVGQSLVVSALALSDQGGFLPAMLDPKSSGPSEASGSLPPEDIYAIVVTNPYYPHERSFYRELGPGVWAWTCSPSIAVATTQGSCVLTATFPTGFSHYMAIYGLKPFSNIRLYGINYSPDAAFESYDVSGYLFRGASNALYLKMKHKQDAEKIELYY